MKRTRKHFAPDGHQATTIASVRKDSGRVIARTILPTDESALGGPRTCSVTASQKCKQGNFESNCQQRSTQRVHSEVPSPVPSTR